MVKNKRRKNKNYKKKQQKYKIGICSECKVREGDLSKKKLYECRFCKEWFCKFHLRPKIVGVANFKNPNYNDLELIEESHKPGGHPCYPYMKYKKAEQKREEEKRRIALDRLLKSESFEEKIETPIGITIPEEECSYYSCHKKAVDRCKYCGELFCDEHIDPKPVGIINFRSNSKESQEFREISRKPGGHPCPEYTKIWKKEKELRYRKYSQALDKICKSKPLKKPLKKCTKTLVLFTLFIIIIFLILHFLGIFTFFQIPFTCTDGTLYNHCSSNKPYYCFNGTLIKKASVCGCPYDYKAISDNCEKIQRCNDGSIYGKCSSKKPFYCLNGTLVKKPSLCGCPINKIPKGDVCISKFEVKPKNVSLKYVLRGKTGLIRFTVYGGVNDYLSELPRSISYYEGEPEPTTKDFVMKYLNDDIQMEYLKPLAEKIKRITPNKDDQARIAISLVQHIPYDYEGLTTDDLNSRYPYEVIYDNKGICGEKSELLAFLLRELEFDIVLFNFEIENHMAVGVKCPIKYSYKNIGYCFIETARPTIITDSQEEYVGVGKLSSIPEIIHVSEGASFNTVSEEYKDAQEWTRINEISKSSDGYLDYYLYNRWLYLVNKYGIEINKE